VLNLSQEPLTFGMVLLLRGGVQFAPILPAGDANVRRAHEEAISNFLYGFANKLEWANRRMSEQQGVAGNNEHTRRTGRASNTLYYDLKRRFSTRSDVVSRYISFQQLELLFRARDILRRSDGSYTCAMNI
jgi:hypothetical protein